ncbi:hypothetical protein AHF37_01827 [Paragonimus kellicotti]|nr:hypothetical protein AHF37_01827 [Paragonimus kellicotti]
MDVQLEDAGVYECQVTPVQALNHPLLRRKTQLSVLVKPSPPRILYPDVPPPDNQLIISQPDPIMRITVLCVATGGSPPPSFRWILNNHEIPAKLIPTPSHFGRPEQAPWAKLAPIIETNPQKEESRLSILKSGLNDGDQLVCSVTNAATQMHHDPQQHNLTTWVIIRIHTPPGPPKIINPETNHEYIEGEELRAVCVASPPGNPFGGLFWRWLLQPAQVDDPNIGSISGLGGRGGARLNEYSSVEAYLQAMDSRATAGGHTPAHGERYHPRDLISEDVQPLHYTLKKEKDQLINTLIIPHVKRRYHAAKLICETGHPVGNAHQTSINIYVKHCPANVTISAEGDMVRDELVGGRREFVVYGRAGKIKTLICRTGPYFRQANIKWIAQTLDSDITKPPRQLIGQSRIMRTPDGESWFQESRVDVRIAEEDDRSYIDCRVWGEGDCRVDSRVRLDIIYPPGIPIITGYKSHQPIKMAHALELTCTSIGGNPAPELVWFRDKQPLMTKEELIAVGRQTSLKLKLVPQKDDNGAHYHCLARNSATDVGVTSESLILNVIFPPQRVTVSFHGQSVVSSGQPLVINCQADTSNPVATITWWHFRCGPAHVFDQVESVHHPPGHRVPNDRRGMEGAKCKSEQLEGIDEQPTPGAAGGVQANSRLWLRPTWHYHMDFIECRTENLDYGPPVWHDRLQLNITFAPQFLGLQVGNEHVIREGQTLHLDLGPYANPPVTSVSWTVDGQSIQPEPLLGTVEPGLYTAGHMGELLALHKVDRSHMNNYTVSASNVIGESRAVFFLNVTFPAGLVGDAIVNVTQTGDDDIYLECEATANPAVATQAFTWYRHEPPPGWPQDVNEAAVQISPPIPCNQTTSVPASDDKLFVLCQQVDLTHIRSRLTIYRVTKEDVGTYVCEVNNGLGEAVQKRINFMYHFSPSIIQLPRYTKAAGEQGSTVTLTCLIRTEPTPQVGWLKAGEQIQSKSNAAGQEKYLVHFEHIRPGLYKSSLTVNNLQKSDFGTYHCQVRWRQAEGQTMFRYADVAANDNHHAVEYLITGKSNAHSFKFNDPEQTFRLSVLFILILLNRTSKWYGILSECQFNELKTRRKRSHEFYSCTNGIMSVLYCCNPADDSYQTVFLRLFLPSDDSPFGSPLVPPLSSAGPSDDNALLIIVAACVFGFVVLVVNLVVITFLVKRRKQRRLLARQSKLRAQQNSGLATSNGFTMVPQTTTFDGPVKQGLNNDQSDPLAMSFVSDYADRCECVHEADQNRVIQVGYATILNEQISSTIVQVFKQKVMNAYFLRSTRHHSSKQQQQQQHLVYGHAEQENMPEFSHISTNQLANGFPLNQSYHSSSTLDRTGFGLGSLDQLDPNSSRRFMTSDMNPDPLNMYGMPSESMLQQQNQGRTSIQPQLHQYTPRQSATHTVRYAGNAQNPTALKGHLDVENKQNRKKMRTFSNTLPRNSELSRIPGSTQPSDPNFMNGPNIDSHFSNGLTAALEVQNIPDSSRQILTSGLAAFSQCRIPTDTIANPHFNESIEASSVMEGQQDLMQLVSIKFAEPAAHHSVESTPQICSLPRTFYNEHSIEYALSPGCTPLLLSLDTSAPIQFTSSNGLLMTESMPRYNLSVAQRKHLSRECLKCATLSPRVTTHPNYTHQSMLNLAWPGRVDQPTVRSAESNRPNNSMFKISPSGEITGREPLERMDKPPPCFTEAFKHTHPFSHLNEGKTLHRHRSETVHHPDQGEFCLFM